MVSERKLLLNHMERIEKRGQKSKEYSLAEENLKQWYSHHQSASQARDA